jgi:hypothetical protein
LRERGFEGRGGIYDRRPVPFWSFARGQRHVHCPHVSDRGGGHGDGEGVDDDQDDDKRWDDARARNNDDDDRAGFASYLLVSPRHVFKLASMAERRLSCSVLRTFAYRRTT